MPELPEVETTRIGIAPFLLGEVVQSITVRNYKLRWPILKSIHQKLPGQEIREVKRRGKYIILMTDQASVIIHLGMSGHLNILLKPTPPQKHDHVDIVFNSGITLRFTDPRRFGCFIYTKTPYQHKLLSDLGVEPLSEDFSADYLYKKSRTRKTSIKNLIMDAKVVVGIGNIYANESLFKSEISPKRHANKISFDRYQLLVQSIKEVLENALQKGGTTLRDFVNSEGKPGYFQQELAVYGRDGQACFKCKKPIQIYRLGQRSTYYCSNCQH